MTKNIEVDKFIYLFISILFIFLIFFLYNKKYYIGGNKLKSLKKFLIKKHNHEDKSKLRDIKDYIIQKTENYDTNKNIKKMKNYLQEKTAFKAKDLSELIELKYALM